MKEDLIQNLVENFEKGPAKSGRLMRDLLEADRDAFFQGALASLRLAVEKRGYRYLIALLAGNDMLSKCLSDPSLSLPTAVMLARIGMQMDPALDTALARRLKDSMRNDSAGREADTARTLAILGEISEGTRLLPLLTQLLQHPNPRIRSKVALLIGRRNKSSRWVEQRKVEKDPRVRANAIEGLWGVEDEGARNVLWEACHDPNNRVAGNAWLGLYRIGDTRSISLTLQMAAHGNPVFRATAAWVMGESADPRFLAALGRMLADSDSKVRTCAFRSLSRIRRRMASRSASLAVYLWEARQFGDGARQLRVSVVDAEGGFPAVAATEFLVRESGQAAVAYDVERRPASGALVVGFAVPRRVEAEPSPLERTLLDCLARKRPGDPWGLTPYNLEHADGAEGDAEPPRFTAKASALREMIEKRAWRSGATASLLEATRCLLTGAALLPGERHLLLVSSPLEARSLAQEADAVTSRARHHGVTIHALVVSGERAPALEALCGATGGHLLQVDRPEQAGAALSRMYWGCQYQHEIHYRLEEGGQPLTLPAPTVQVQVWSECGSGEDALPLG